MKIFLTFEYSLSQPLPLRTRIHKNIECYDSLYIITGAVNEKFSYLSTYPKSTTPFAYENP